MQANHLAAEGRINGILGPNQQDSTKASGFGRLSRRFENDS